MIAYVAYDKTDGNPCACKGIGIVPSTLSNSPHCHKKSPLVAQGKYDNVA